MSYTTLFQGWARFAWKVGELTIASNQVIMERSQLFWLRGPFTAYQSQELQRMVQEKYSAAMLSSWALMAGYFEVAPRIGALAVRQWIDGWSPRMWTATRSSRIATSLNRTAIRAIAPVHKRATANAKRLRRKPLRT